MSALLTRIERAERAAGIGGPCEVCAIAAEYDARLGELTRVWGIKPLPQGKRVRSSCVWCGRVVTYPAAGYTPEEVAAFERADALYRRGEICLPEYERLAEIARAAGPRMLRVRFGEHGAEVLRLKNEYRQACEGLREMRAATAYLCRVPGCACEYPKTLAEWRDRVTANGYTMRS